MARRDLSRIDRAQFERSQLEYVLDKDKRDDDTRYVGVDEALSDEGVYEVESSRDITRVLFISKDETLLNPTQQSLDGYINIAELFDEVHILILRQGIPTKTPVIRIGDNVWLYTATSHYWWLTSYAGVKLAKDQLVFAAGFRPDIIVARDPFESALTGMYLAKNFERPLQVHVLENFYRPQFLASSRANRWRKWLARYVLRQVTSVRVSTRAIFEVISKHFKIKDLALLPRFNNYEALIQAPATIELRDRYKPFVFIILYIGKLDQNSLFYRALDGARFGLRNPHIGMIAIGNGPSRKEFEKRAEILMVRPQVVFETGVQDLVPYLKSANVLIVPDTDADSEEIVLRGAAAGIPMIMARTPTREDLFVDGESALFCDPQNADEISLKLNMLMNDIMLRRQLVEAAQLMVTSRFHEDPVAYRTAYRASIEQVLFVAGEDNAADTGASGEKIVTDN